MRVDRELARPVRETGARTRALARKDRLRRCVTPLNVPLTDEPPSFAEYSEVQLCAYVASSSNFPDRRKDFHEANS